MTEPQSWQCGGCKTWYAPFIEKCECEHDSAEDAIGIRYIPQPYPVPMQDYWYPYKHMPWQPVITWSSTTTSASSDPKKAREWFLSNGVKVD